MISLSLSAIAELPNWSRRWIPVSLLGFLSRLLSLSMYVSSVRKSWIVIPECSELPRNWINQLHWRESGNLSGEGAGAERHCGDSICNYCRGRGHKLRSPPHSSYSSDTLVIVWITHTFTDYSLHLLETFEPCLCLTAS